MRRCKPLGIGVAVACCGLVAGARAMGAEEERKLGWHDSAEVGYVFTSGNAESSSLGFKNTATRLWPESELVIKLGGIRVETTTFTRFAVGPDPGSATITEDESTETTAEAYFLNGRYLHNITPKFFWFSGAGWERNRFSGIDNRYVVEAGVGNLWRDDGDVKFRTDYAATLTRQEDVVEQPDVDDTWAGLRVGWDYANKFGKSATYGNTLVVDLNVEETDDWRADMLNTLAVTMSDHLALKVSLRWLYDHEPAFTDVPLFDAAPPGGTLIGAVPFQLDELDTIFSTTLVVNF